MDISAELGEVHDFQRARARDLYLHILHEAAGTRRQHEDPVGKKDCFGD